VDKLRGIISVIQSSLAIVLADTWEQGVGIDRQLDFLGNQIKRSGPKPVDRWDPPFCGAIDIRIAADGTWYHEGDPIKRQSLVRLFSSVLKREGENFYLVTPVEKLAIQVDDCPFLAHSMEIRGRGRSQTIDFVLLHDEVVRAVYRHRIIVPLKPGCNEPRPRIEVRCGLDALLSRALFYELVDSAEEQSFPDQKKLGIWSGGTFHELGHY